jgi:N-acetylglucosaminyl-diphospho-decaprenol L-rhamnosyltransferase
VSGDATQHPHDLAIVIVSWNVRDLLERCLASIASSLAGSALRSTTVVVDNASQDGTTAMLAATFPDVRVLANTANRGFAGGVNDGLAALGVLPTASRPDAPRYVFVLNPDTEIVGDALARMVAYMDAHPRVAVVGPLLRYADGSIQSSRRRFPTVAALFWESTVLEQWWPSNPWARQYRLEDRAPAEEQAVEWLVGAALLVRGSAITVAGGLDEQFFMYSEELEWQERITRTMGARVIMFLPDAVVMHYEGRSSEQNLLRRHLNFQRSKLRYAQMRFGVPVARALRGFLLASYALQAVIEAAKWALGHKRPLRAARVRQYVEIVRSGL